MTIEIGTQKLGRIGRRGGAPMASSLPIGELDANMFACPACSRPLGNGTHRCPTCGTRLIAGVRASRAVAFAGIGLLTGILLSGATFAVASVLASRPAATALADAPPVVTPPTAPVVSAAAPAVDPGIPGGAASALRQTTLLHGRVLADAERLTVALAGARPSSAEIAPILRRLASTAAFGAGLAPSVGQWDEAGGLSRDLDAFYGAISETAEAGLSASLANRIAYESAAERMLEVISGVGALDTASRSLAASQDLMLPPLSPPAR